MKILLTGANGYIGSRLMPLLVEKGHEVYALVRSKGRFNPPKHIQGKVHVVEGDLLKPETLTSIPQDIDIAYYLVHSMAQSKSAFDTLEKQCAENFIAALQETHINQIIYLSGLIPEEKISMHLASRQSVENILHSSGIPTTTLRAGIIIGSGSASYEIIRDLVELLPVMVAPKWVYSRCQPIAIYDVLHYLVGVIGREECFNRSFDIGGPDILNYKEMLYTYADVRGLKRKIISVPVLTPKLSSYWLYFVTSTNFTLATSLVDSLKCDAVCRDDAIKAIVPRKCLSYREAIERSLARIDQNAVISSWKDALVQSSLNPDLAQYINVPTHGCLTDKKKMPIEGDPEAVLQKLWAIGGKTGWYYMNWAWSLRGFIDKVFGGVGLRRGRTHPDTLMNGDALDFWRVIIADKPNRHLLLYAEMKLPGEAWLEYKIIKEGDKHYLTQNATFRPKGLLGRLYWYGLLPFHELIFYGMARAIASAP